MLILLEQNLFKNVSEGPDFLWQTQIGLNDTIPKKKEWSYKDTFSNDFGAQSEISKKLSEKSWSVRTILILLCMLY